MLSFRLKLPGTDRFDGPTAVSTSFRVEGFLSLEDEILTIQWGGVARVQEVGPLSLRDEREVLPGERVVVSVRALHGAALVGGWWRPRLVLQAREPGALGDVPTEKHGTVQLWYARRDRTVAVAMAAAINDAIALGEPADTPSAGLNAG